MGVGGRQREDGVDYAIDEQRVSPAGDKGSGSAKKHARVLLVRCALCRIVLQCIARGRERERGTRLVQRSMRPFFWRTTSAGSTKAASWLMATWTVGGVWAMWMCVCVVQKSKGSTSAVQIIQSKGLPANGMAGCLDFFSFLRSVCKRCKSSTTMECVSTHTFCWTIAQRFPHTQSDMCLFATMGIAAWHPKASRRELFPTFLDSKSFVISPHIILHPDRWQQQTLPGLSSRPSPSFSHKYHPLSCSLSSIFSHSSPLPQPKPTLLNQHDSNHYDPRPQMRGVEGNRGS